MGKFLIYLVCVIALGALLAPPLFWGAQSLAAHGIFPALGGFKFAKFFDRAALIAAVLLLWPLIRSLRVSGWRDLGLAPDVRWALHWIGGFAIAAFAVAIMAFAYVGTGVYRLRPNVEWGRLPLIAISAVTVGFLEEALFRGAIFGLLRRTMKPYAALFWVTALFAIAHFLKPDDRFDSGAIGWLSGFALVPHVFHQFAETTTLLAGFTTLFALGWLCGDATLRTRSLWLSSGLHTGVVFVKMSFAVISKRRETHLPWIGPELQIGLVPVCLLLLAWVAVLLLLSRENRAFRP